MFAMNSRLYILLTVVLQCVNVEISHVSERKFTTSAMKYSGMSMMQHYMVTQIVNRFRSEATIIAFSCS